MSNTKIDYNKLLKETEYTIEKLTIDIVTGNVYKSPKTEERLTALCLAREYIKEKIEQLKYIEEAPLTSLLDVDGYPMASLSSKKCEEELLEFSRKSKIKKVEVNNEQ